MERKRSKGITLLGWFFVLTCPFTIFKSFYVLIRNENINTSLTIIGMFIAFIVFILAINLLRLKEWSRIGFIINCIVSIFIGIYEYVFPVHMGVDRNYLIIGETINILISVSLIYFLTRPKVKEQFN